MINTWKEVVLLVVIALLLGWVVSYQLKIEALYTSLQLKDSIIYCYEHPTPKGVRRHLRKDGEVR